MSQRVSLPRGSLESKPKPKPKPKTKPKGISGIQKYFSGEKSAMPVKTLNFSREEISVG